MQRGLQLKMYMNRIRAFKKFWKYSFLTQIHIDKKHSWKIYILKIKCMLKNSKQIFFSAAPCSMWDLSSLTRDQTHTPCTGSMES